MQGIWCPLWPPWAPDMCTWYMYICRQNTRIHKIILLILRNLTLCLFEYHSFCSHNWVFILLSAYSGSLGAMSLFYMKILNCLYTIYWRNYPSLLNGLFKNNWQHTDGLFLDPQFYFTYLYVYSYACTTMFYYSFMNFEIETCKSSDFIFQDCYDYSKSFITVQVKFKLTYQLGPLEI